MSDLQRYLSVTHNLPSDYVRSVLTPKLRSIARLVFDASKSRLVRHNGTFQMVGLDIMLDSHFNPHLIEGTTKRTDTHSVHSFFFLQPIKILQLKTSQQANTNCTLICIMTCLTWKRSSC